MKALHYDGFGGLDQLSVGELPDPHIGPDTLLVKVVAAGINPVDYKVREGYLEGLIDTVFPVVPGWDVAGVVVSPGLDTPEFAAGDEVLAYARADVVHGGTLAELVAVPVRAAAHKPASVSFEDAAALPLAGLTALQSVRRSGLKAGDAVLVHAAAGGVGSFATQLAVLAGARVVGTPARRTTTIFEASAPSRCLTARVWWRPRRRSFPTGSTWSLTTSVAQRWTPPASW